LWGNISFCECAFLYLQCVVKVVVSLGFFGLVHNNKLHVG